MTTPPQERLPRVAFDLVSCDRKALKIGRLLNLAVRRQPLRMIDGASSVTASALRRFAKPWPLSGRESRLRVGLGMVPDR